MKAKNKEIEEEVEVELPEEDDENVGGEPPKKKSKKKKSKEEIKAIRKATLMVMVITLLLVLVFYLIGNWSDLISGQWLEKMRVNNQVEKQEEIIETKNQEKKDVNREPIKDFTETRL